MDRNVSVLKLDQQEEFDWKIILIIDVKGDNRAVLWVIIWGYLTLYDDLWLAEENFSIS